jgi:hypothetical protein
MHYRALTVFVSVLFLASHVAAQSSTGQPAKVNAAIEVIVDSLQFTHNGLIVSLTYINHLKEPIQFTLAYPIKKAGFASDNLGSEYTLTNATGMIRKHEQPNLDLARPDLPNHHSTFLLAPPETKVSASFQFKRSGSNPQSKDRPTNASISISHYARPAENFDPKQPSRAFGFTATITNAKAQ